MNKKLVSKKQLILITAFLLILAILTIVFMQARKSVTHNQKDASVITESIPITNTPVSEAIDKNDNDGTRYIYVYSVDRTLRDILNKYAQEHWDFPYSINFYADDIVFSSKDIINISSDKLVNDPSSLDMYCVPAYAAKDFVTGELSEYACTFKELGIDVDNAIDKAEIPQYAIENGRNADGELVALPYLSTVSVFVYHRSIAKEVWGTDDPKEITDILGGGTQSWDSFKQAALALKEHGYYITPGFKDLYSTGLSSSIDSNGKINPQWLEYMDVSKYLYDNGCITDTSAWTEQWYKDLNGVGNKIFGFVTYTDYYLYLGSENTANDWAICMSPVTVANDYYTGPLVNKNSPNKDILGQFIEWLTFDSSETGLQYQIATGTFEKFDKLSVISGTVLKKADSSRDCLGGQNINPIIYEALQNPFGTNELTSDRMNDYYYWDEAIKAYLWGGKDKETVIDEFKKATAAESLPGPEPEQDAVILWKNKSLERAIRNELKKPNSDIYLSDTSKVTELHLEGKGLDSLEDIENFPNLTQLYCSENDLQDINSLKRLTKLEVLYLNDNNITDISCLQELVNLKELNLSMNKIVDIQSLAGLTNLKSLYLMMNKINDINSLAGLRNLEALEIYQNDISNIDSIKNLTKLQLLSIFDNRITDISPLKELVSLQQLLLDRNKLSDISSLEGSINLNTLSLSDNEISDINSLSGMTNLIYLLLNNNRIKEIDCLSNLQSLNSLELKGNEISDISNFTGLENLAHLDLSENDISEINSLKGFTKLDSLFLAYNKLSDISFISDIKSLKSLSLVGNDIKDKSPAKGILYVSW